MVAPYPVTFMIDAIAGAIDKGDYLSFDHTAEHFRDQLWFPQLLDRRRLGEWEADGEQTMGDRIRSQVRQLIAEHRAPALDSQVAAQLDSIVGEGRG